MSEDQKSRTKNFIYCKLILVGDSGVGKTCMINRYLKKYNPDVPATLSTSYYTKLETINNCEIHFQIWDTVGQEQYRSLNTLFFKDANICIIVYDITREESFNNIKDYWYESVMTNGAEGIICGIAGNKNDLIEYEKVNRDEVKDFCEEIDAVHKFTSAKNNFCIDELFKELGKKFICSEYMKQTLENYFNWDKEEKSFSIGKKKENKNNSKDKMRCC